MDSARRKASSLTSLTTTLSPLLSSKRTAGIPIVPTPTTPILTGI